MSANKSGGQFNESSLKNVELNKTLKTLKYSGQTHPENKTKPMKDQQKA